MIEAKDDREELTDYAKKFPPSRLTEAIATREIQKVYEKWSKKDAVSVDYHEWFQDMWNAIEKYCKE